MPAPIFDHSIDFSGLEILGDDNTKQQVKGLLYLAEDIERVWQVAEDAEQHLKIAQLATACGMEKAAQHHSDMTDEMTAQFRSELNGVNVLISDWADKWSQENILRISEVLESSRSTILSEQKKQFRQMTFEDAVLMPDDAIDFLKTVDSALDSILGASGFDKMIDLLKGMMVEVEAQYRESIVPNPPPASQRRAIRCNVRTVVKGAVTGIFGVLAVVVPFVPAVKKMQRNTADTYRHCRGQKVTWGRDRW